MPDRRQLGVALALLVSSCGGPPTTKERVPACPPDGTTATWTNHAKPFVETWCTGCHHSAVTGDDRQGAPEGVDYDTFEGVRNDALAIHERVVVLRDMPRAGGPTDEERALLGEWIACGMPGGAVEPPDPCTGPPRPRAGDLIVDSAADLDAFCSTYDAVEGDVLVQGGGVLALDCLCDVTGSVSIAGAAGTTSVRFPELRTVGGDVAISGNPGLQNVELPVLIEIGGALDVVDNVALVDADVTAVEDVGGDVAISGNPALDEARLARLFTVGGALAIEDNGSMQSISLDRILTVGGDLRIVDNAALKLIFGDAYQLEVVGGDLILSGNSDLEGFYGFIELLAVGGDIELNDNDSFENFFAFTRLETLGGSMRISGNARLGQIGGFEFIERIPGGLTIEDNPVMRYIDGFRVLTDVGTGTSGALVLSDLPQLDGITGLQSLTSTGALTIERTGLTALGDLHGIESIDGNLIVVDNTSLPSLEVDNLVSAVGAQNIGGYVTNSGNAP